MWFFQLNFHAKHTKTKNQISLKFIVTGHNRLQTCIAPVFDDDGSTVLSVMRQNRGVVIRMSGPDLELDVRIRSKKHSLLQRSCRQVWKKSICFWLFDFRGQFHLHFTFSFYVPRSQKPQKDGQLKQLFALLGSAGVKAVHKHVDEIDPWFLHTGLGKNVEWSMSTWRNNNVDFFTSKNVDRNNCYFLVAYNNFAFGAVELLLFCSKIL